MAEETEKQETPEVRPRPPSKLMLIGLTVVVAILVVYGIALNVRNVMQQSAETGKTSETGETQDIGEEEQQEVVVETEEATVSAGGQELPDNFPDDIPIYPRAAIISTSSSKVGVAVNLETDDALSVVSDYYKTELTAKGWEISQTATLTNAVVFGFTKAGVEGAVALTESEEGTAILVSVDLETE